MYYIQNSHKFKVRYNLRGYHSKRHSASVPNYYIFSRLGVFILHQLDMLTVPEQQV